MEKTTNNEGKIRNINLFAFPRLLSFQLNGHRRAETVIHVATTQTLQKNERKQQKHKKKTRSHDATTRKRPADFISSENRRDDEDMGGIVSLFR
jgi:hypothetical protein